MWAKIKTQQELQQVQKNAVVLFHPAEIPLPPIPDEQVNDNKNIYRLHEIQEEMILLTGLGQENGYFSFHNVYIEDFIKDPWWVWQPVAKVS